MFWVCTKCQAHVDSGKDAHQVVSPAKEAVGVLWVCPNCSYMRLELGDAKYLDIAGERVDSGRIEIFEANFLKK